MSASDSATGSIFDDVSLRIMRGDRVGILGPNGAGKTTLIRLIVGTLEPDQGKIRRGTNLQVAYFDQLREQLDPEKTLSETVSPGSDWIEVAGQRKHISSYLGDFLFSTRRANAPIRMLSGGERNRLLLARLFARPANVLVLDEPTNDLDIDSLELLESMLQDYAGTLLLVSHDRAFLDNVVTQTVAAEGNGRWREYVGGYTDWLRQRTQPRAPDLRAAPAAAPQAEASATPKRKLSYKEQRELESLPANIEALENEQQALHDRVCAPDYHRAGRRTDAPRPGTHRRARVADRHEHGPMGAARSAGIEDRRRKIMKPGLPANRRPSASGRRLRIAAARA